MKAARGLVDWWVDHPLVDVLIGSLIGVVAFFVRVSDYVEIEDHGSLYETLVMIPLTMVGFGAIAVTIITTVTPSARLTRVLSAVRQPLIKVMFRSILHLVIGAGAFLLLYAFDNPDAAGIRSGLVVGAMALTVSSAGRLLWVLYRLVEVGAE